MKFLTNLLLALSITAAVVFFQSCKTKKEVTKPAPVAAVVVKPDTVAKPKADAPSAPPSMMNVGPVALKPDYNFKNIQFEFNSAVLKTGSIEILDHVAAEMKKDPSVNFVLNGNASAEGTEQHNMELSVQRASAVKTYLINSGISDSNLTVKGYGETKPVADNSTEEGRALNRRVEIKVIK